MKKYLITLYWKSRAWIWITKWKMWILALQRMEDQAALQQIQNTRIKVETMGYTQEWKDCFTKALDNLENAIKQNQ